MLIEFSVSNYRSFREKQTLSMVATPRLSKKRNVFKPVVKGEKIPALLKVAAIYGPNASGKSSLIKAIGMMREIFFEAPTAAKESLLPAQPFRFDPALKEQPSRFEYNFIKGGLRYQFTLALTQRRIVEETLFAYPKGKESLMYSRTFGAGGEVYVYGEDLEGGKQVHEAWRKLTSPKVLFISQAVANSSEDLTQLKQPLSWFSENLLIVEQDTMRGWSLASRSILQDNPALASDLGGFLQEIDIPVSNIRTESQEDISSAFFSAEKQLSREDFAKLNACQTTLTHTSVLGSAEFDFSEESGGTQNLMGFWLPWVKTENGGSLLAVDELDSSLHPKIVADLIEKHLDSGIDSQLIFTTHDTHLMNAKILRRDQFWITERDAYGATNLFSIHDFEGREGEDIEKRYFEGRYRGLPLIRRR